ncbi:hypothetical protein LYSHEL_08710 [Lysobacter helvus]|uniref:GtrA/DPMS transmembrane domain-containing protein n=2 Tax=Lysobacteraceae TaxID=32033 RepID=A0ABM7Q3N6_9GAMM|nr:MULTISPECIES: GtrA family protein [Lysobacter]BCT91847.1 hypothetical protein LYSCAS_08710 [Lysobacter caseinilyticus]BCT95000.1 hypothetical protein LYSHEL_08710 [Lysobacter helvus]
MSATSRPKHPLRALLHDQRVRFLLVGGWNTAIGYLAFVLVHALAGARLGAIGTLFASYCLALPHSYLTQRLIVFRHVGRWYAQFPRFAFANTILFAANLVLLPLLSRATGELLVAQAISIVLITCATYLVHKHFSFASRT